MSVRVAIIYYSATGSIHALADAVAEGAAKEGADIALRRVPELAPDTAIDQDPEWRAHLNATRDIPEATLDDLTWANAYAFGTPTRFGLPAAQLKQFLDTTGPLWIAGDLSDKPVTTFTSAMNQHGGQESTILALNNTFYHWGCVIIPPGYTHEVLTAAGGNPYGTCWPSGYDGNKPDDITLAAARYQGQRLAQFAAKLAD
jgi:NAD(P)H dehydrogenase (quinone)